MNSPASFHAQKHFVKVYRCTQRQAESILIFGFFDNANLFALPCFKFWLGLEENSFFALQQSIFHFCFHAVICLFVFSLKFLVFNLEETGIFRGSKIIRITRNYFSIDFRRDCKLLISGSKHPHVNIGNGYLGLDTHVPLQCMAILAWN